MKKQILAVLLTMFMCFTLTGCGDNESGEVNNNKQQGEKQPEKQEEPQVSDSMAWPDNEFTKQVIKPSQPFKAEANCDNSSCNIYLVWTIAEAKAYVTELETKGFHITSTYIDNEESYMVYLKNSDESYQVGVITDNVSDGTLQISIPLNKR